MLEVVLFKEVNVEVLFQEFKFFLKNLNILFDVRKYLLNLKSLLLQIQWKLDIRQVIENCHISFLRCFL